MSYFVHMALLELGLFPWSNLIFSALSYYQLVLRRQGISLPFLLSYICIFFCRPSAFSLASLSLSGDFFFFFWMLDLSEHLLTQEDRAEETGEIQLESWMLSNRFYLLNQGTRSPAQNCRQNWALEDSTSPEEP